jgi:hypothetical protein
MCDQWCFVPKFKVNTAQVCRLGWAPPPSPPPPRNYHLSGSLRCAAPQDQLMYMIRPDVCCMGCCVKCKCDGQKGKCFRVPFYIRDPQTMDPIDTRQAVVRAGPQTGRARPTQPPCSSSPVPTYPQRWRCWRAWDPLPASPDSATPCTLTLLSEVGPSRFPGWRHRRSRTCGRA